MQSFMITLMICSVTMSALALFYMAVTLLLTKRYSAASRYYTWIIVVIGFIIPFRPQFNNAIVKVDIPSNAVVSNIQIGSGTSVTAPFENALSSALPTISLWQIAAVVWFVGMVIFFGYHVIKHYRFLKLAARWSERITDEQILTLMQSLKSQMDLSKNIGLQFCDSIGSPMMIGFIHPRILLPKTDFAKDELCFILKHELVHYQRKDLWYKCLVLIATAIHWFNPIVYLMAKAIDIQCELSCDEKVVRGANTDIRLYYSETIIGVVRYQSKLKTALSTNFYGGKKGMKKRVFSIMDMSKKKVGIAVLCATLLFTLGTGFAFAASSKAENGNTLQAYSTETVITQQEQAELKRQQTAELTKQFAVYTDYGLIYEPKTDSLYYDGKLVRRFSDKTNADNQYIAFVRSNDGIDLRAERNSSYELTGIKEVSQEEYNKNTQSIKAASSVNGAYEQGDPNNDFNKDLLKDYLEFGISYNKDSKHWFYNDKPIYFFTDNDKITYLDGSVDTAHNGIAIQVIRNSNGQIDNLTKITKSQVDELMNTTQER